jgi:ADP-ribose pyrophosphatase
MSPPSSFFLFNHFVVNIRILFAMTPKPNKSELIYQGRVFKLFRDNVTLQNNRSVNLDVIRHPGAAAIVALTDHNEIFLLKQYRYAAGGFIWEIPAGTVDPGESPLECAQREIVEEAGVSADSWDKIGEITPVPGYSDERIHLFLAQDLKGARQDLDDDEIIDIHKINFKEVLSMVYSGEISDAKTIAGIFLAQNRMNSV